MPLLARLTPEKLTPSRLWSELDVETRTMAARSLYTYEWGEHDAKLEANTAIAATLRFRELAVRKLPVEKRAHYLARTVNPGESLASSLLMALHMVHRQELLATFLDALEIPHTAGIIDEKHELGSLAPDRLQGAVDLLRQRFAAEEIDVYLTTLVALDRQVWGGLAPIIWTARQS